VKPADRTFFHDDMVYILGGFLMANSQKEGSWKIVKVRYKIFSYQTFNVSNEFTQYSE